MAVPVLACIAASHIHSFTVNAGEVYGLRFYTFRIVMSIRLKSFLKDLLLYFEAMKIARWLAVCALVPMAVWAQQAAQPFLEITGDAPRPHTLQEQEWKGLKHISISATNAHDKTTAVYNGVLLRDLLKDAGVPSGETLRGKALSTVIVIIARDGYQVTFSIAELDEGIGNTQVLVADSEDGKPLTQTAGPLRLIVPTDKHPTRWVRMVKTIKVVANP